MKKSYSPTSKKLKRARKDGDIAKSGELTALLTVSWGLVALALVVVFWQQFLTNPHNFFNYTKGIETDVRSLVLLVFVISVLVFSLLFVSVVVEMLQVGLSLNFGLVKPKVSRVNPFSGFKKILGIPEENVSWSFFQSPVFEAAKCFCYWILSLASLYFFRVEIFRAATLNNATPHSLVELSLFSIAPIACVYLTISLMTWWIQQRLQMLRLSMDREELKRELRDSEGREELKHKRHEAYLELGNRVTNSVTRRAKFIVKRD